MEEFLAGEWKHVMNGFLDEQRKVNPEGYAQICDEEGGREAMMESLTADFVMERAGRCHGCHRRRAPNKLAHCVECGASYCDGECSEQHRQESCD